MTRDMIRVEELQRSRELWGTQADSFVEYLLARGYSRQETKTRRACLESFVRWATQERLVVGNMCESRIDEFLSCGVGSRIHAPSNSYKRPVLRLFLAYLREQGVLPSVTGDRDSTPMESLERDYADFLRHECGLTERTVYVYLPFVRGFLNRQVAGRESLDATAITADGIRSFVLSRARDGSPASTKLLASALRSFLRYLYVRGKAGSDLTHFVPTIRRWSLASVPTFLSPDQVERVLGAVDQRKASGLRDYAILLLLARLGLRAGEVITLELSDIRWKIGEFLVRGKGRKLDILPLPTEVGKALATYIENGRDRSTASRRVFLRSVPPNVGLRGPAAVGHVVRRAIKDAGIEKPGRGAAHLFRHGLATTMIRNGASIAEIAEVLRHQSHAATAIYTKVDFQTLSDVASPWPAREGTNEITH